MDVKNSILASLLFICFAYANGQELNCLDVPYKLRGYFYAGSGIIDTEAPGGFYEASNRPKKNDQFIRKIGNNSDLQLVVKTDSIVEFRDGVKGFKVFLINSTDSIYLLSAQDSRISVVRQVYYKNEWQDVEYLPSSSCGNSYHSVYIKPNEYWDFTAPCMEGKIKSKFRFNLHIGVTKDLAIKNLYSNEFEGSFNKEQLKREQGHESINILNPYNN
ncbi:hypothetical protein [Aquimarina sp. SS2-1]|uniref:hypothetical protein n=1 Tax=Aquimarina besae TaxID=3342247 RepID=UPI00366DAC53